MERTKKMTEKVCGFENLNTFNVIAYMENHSEASFRLFCQMADCVKDSLILTREEQINVLAEHYMEFFLQMPPALFDEGISRVGTWRHKMQYLARVNWVEVAEHFFYDW